MANGEDLAAEELILLILKKRTEKEERGDRPTRVVLSMDAYRRIQQYHAELGELPKSIDYITRDSIFNLPVYIDNSRGCDVE
ncbi:MAG: hypothetical protein GVY14_00180 [Spirochaetes bacterium]|jgi:hypothetical protein|nr:hypothetical protein [Spirochaetota bacterium]